MNGSFNDTQTWVNLLNKEAAGKRNDASSTSNGGVGITITSQTPRVPKKSSLHRNERTGENEVLRSQVVNLLKEKQEMIKKVQVDGQIKKALEEELRVLKENRSARANGDNGHEDIPVATVMAENDQISSLELQVSTLREALDSVTKEKNQLRQQHRHNSQRDKSVNNSPKSSSSIASEEEFSLRLQLSQLRDTLYRVERERDTLKTRITGIEAQRQESMEQYQQEVESSMKQVTNQLEELLQLNQQLQAELTIVQKEKEDLAQSLHQEREGRQHWEKEKVGLHRKLESYELQTVKLHNELQTIKDDMLQQTTSSLTAIETLQSQVSETSESSNQTMAKYKKAQSEIQKLKGEVKQLEKTRDEADHGLLDLQHHLTLARQERDSLKTRLQTSQGLVSQLKRDVKNAEEATLTSQTAVSKLQKELDGTNAELTLVKKQIESSRQENKRLTKESSVAQKHCKQQVENLTQQLMHKGSSLSELETDKLQLQSRIKKLENKIQDMAYNHDMNSAQREGDLRTMMSSLDSTMTQLQTTESSNTQLQQKILDLEEEVAGWRRQLAERDSACQELRELVEEKNRRVEDLENTIDKLHQDLTQASSSNGDHQEALLSQIDSLKESLQQVQLERDGLNGRLEAELERNETSSQTEKKLREENSKLQELLNTSLTMNETLQSTLDNSQGADPATPTHTSSPNRKPTTVQVTPPQKYSPLIQFASPETEVIHLKQLLMEGRQTCLNLQRQHEQDKTEMAKIQGSLQALVQIQDHLSTENQSVAESLANLSEEKETYKQESVRLGNDLVSVRQEFDALVNLLGQFKEKAVIKLTEIVEIIENGCQLHNSLVGLLDDLEGSDELNSLKIFDEILEAFCSHSDGASKERNKMEDHQVTLVESLKIATMESERKTRDIESLQNKMGEVSEQVKILEHELEKRNKALTEKEDELTACKRDIEALNQEQLDRTMDTTQMGDYVKDIDAKYQAKIDVLREKLIEKEEEVSGLNLSCIELKERLQLTEETLLALRSETEGKKQGGMECKARLARCETTIRTEIALLDNEVMKQSEDISAMSKEIRDIEDESRTTATINTAQREQLTKCTDQISQLQAEVEMLRAKKTVISKYLLTHESSQDDRTEKERQELIQENDQLLAENEELRQELGNLMDNTEHLNEMIEILRVQLKEIQEEYDERMNESTDSSAMMPLRLELDQAQEQLREQVHLLELERLEVKRAEQERDTKAGELRILEGRIEAIGRDHFNEREEITKQLQEQNEAVSILQETLDSVKADKELLEKRLMNSSVASNGCCANKVRKLKMKLKQQIKQTNHLRMKLGYSISELRLHKQLKTELDSQITQLQTSLTLSQRQNKQCLEKLILAERLVTNSMPYSDNSEREF